MQEDKKTDRTFIAYFILLVMLIFNNSINNIVFSILILAYAVVLAIIYEPIYLIVPYFLTCTIQSYFLITPTLSFSRMLTFIYFFGCFVHYKIKVTNSKLFNYLLIFMLYHLATILWSISGTYSEPVSFALGIITILLMYSDNVEMETVQRLTKLICAMAYTFGLFIIYLTFRLRSQGRLSQIVFDETLNANTICSTLAVFVGLIYAKTLFDGKNKWVNYAFITLCSVTIMFAGSRTSLIGILGVIVLLPLFTGKYRDIDLSKAFKFLALCGVLIGLLYYYMMSNPALYARFTFDESTTTSIDRRVYVWEALWNHVIPEHPFLGIGYGIQNVRYAVKPYVAMVFHSHNMLLAILSETGIVGLVLYLILFIYLIRKILNHKNIYVTMAFSVILVGFIIGIGEETINRRWFWLAIGLVLFYLQNENIKQEDRLIENEAYKLASGAKEKMQNE